MFISFPTVIYPSPSCIKILPLHPILSPTPLSFSLSSPSTSSNLFQQPSCSMNQSHTVAIRAWSQCSSSQEPWIFTRTPWISCRGNWCSVVSSLFSPVFVPLFFIYKNYVACLFIHSFMWYFLGLVLKKNTCTDIGHKFEHRSLTRKNV